MTTVSLSRQRKSHWLKSNLKRRILFRTPPTRSRMYQALPTTMGQSARRRPPNSSRTSRSRTPARSTSTWRTAPSSRRYLESTRATWNSTSPRSTTQPRTWGCRTWPTGPITTRSQSSCWTTRRTHRRATPSKWRSATQARRISRSTASARSPQTAPSATSSTTGMISQTYWTSTMPMANPGNKEANANRQRESWDSPLRSPSTR